MSDELNEENDLINYKNIFSEEPQIYEKHPNAYLSYLGKIMKGYRKSLDREYRSEENFRTKVLAKYFGKPVHRDRLRRAEIGDHTVSFGVYAAYLYEMEAFPEIIQILEKGDKRNLRYLTLVEKGMEEKIKAAMEECNQKLSERASTERGIK